MTKLGDVSWVRLDASDPLDKPCPFRRERFFYGILHNETSKIIQRRLQWVGVPMVVLPIRAKV
ncbi:MAG: hypothetical protein ACREMY_14440 [bacterium]